MMKGHSTPFQRILKTMYTNQLHQELFQPFIKKEKDCIRHFVFRPATEETEDSAEDIFNLFIKKNGRGDW